METTEFSNTNPRALYSPRRVFTAFRKLGSRGYSVICRRERGCGGGWRSCYGLTNTHCFPVVAELLPTIETHNVGAVTICACGHFMARRQRKGSSTVRATEQRI